MEQQDTVAGSEIGREWLSYATALEGLRYTNSYLSAGDRSCVGNGARHSEPVIVKPGQKEKVRSVTSH